MALSLIQPGTGDALCVYAAPSSHVGPGTLDATTAPSMSAQALAALGSGPCVVGIDARAEETPSEIMAFARQETGRTGLWWAALIGASRGCDMVRHLYLAGADALAIVLADGMQGQHPPTPVELGFAQSTVAFARAGAMVTIILHTYLDAGPEVTSTASMARLATGWALVAPRDGEIVRRVQQPEGAASQSPTAWRGQLVVYSTGSGPTNEAAHRHVLGVALPLALRDFVRPLVSLPEPPAARPGMWLLMATPIRRFLALPS